MENTGTPVSLREVHGLRKKHGISFSARGKHLFGRMLKPTTGFNHPTIIYDSESKKSCIVDVQCAKGLESEGDYSWDALDFKIEYGYVITIECSSESKKLRVTSIFCEKGVREVLGMQYIEPEWKDIEYSWFKPPPLFGYYEFQTLTRDMNRILKEYMRDPKSTRFIKGEPKSILY